MHAFDGARGGTMRLSAVRADPERVRIVLDDGPGIARDALAQI